MTYSLFGRQAKQAKLESVFTHQMSFLSPNHTEPIVKTLKGNLKQCTRSGNLNVWVSTLLDTLTHQEIRC